ncbi:AAA family ATPase [Methylobacterium thuringiense]|uniref:ATP-dependent zinc metalloprotease FtsH n=1 Tax=Methylobacterium thuringiense TaxID=1003091 RepID=A0ABQ4TI19_9HYPH|nr:AAA family ATPase [Methylobacterium thuringiense]GJE54883.1 ATP-dependent zinc metalloprotease FtsH [Methylobacterium thuringiense]
MRSDLAFFREDTDEEATVGGGRPLRETASAALARLALEAALTPAQRRRIARDPNNVLVVQVPAAEWVDAIRSACERLRPWDAVFARTGSREDMPSRGNDKVARTVGQGGAVLGVSQDCHAYLPSALSSADINVRIEPPDNKLVGQVIRAVTGRAVRDLPDGAAAGLSYWDLAACIRGTSKASLERLAAASRAKTVIDPAVATAPPFASLLGFGAAHEWGTRLLRGIEDWRRNGTAFPADRCAVLASEPGLGKSTMVRALAKAAKLPLTISSVSSWFTSSNGYLDGVLKHIDLVFDQARYTSPSLLFLDEIDSIPDRNSLDDRSRSWWNPVCTHILLRIDRLNNDPDAKVCLIGATNYANRLDTALIRPGRLTRVIQIGRPGAEAISGIARQHLGSDLPGADLRTLGELGLGATGAEVEGWVKEARSRAQTAGRPLALDDLLRCVAPPDTRTDAEIRRGAIHEAGHGLGAQVVGAGAVIQVDIIARNGNGGSTAMRPRLPIMPLRDDVERLVVSLLCGRAAEVVILGEACGGSGGSADSDLARASALLAGLHGSLGLGQGLVYLGQPSEVAGGLRQDSVLRAAVEADLHRLHSEAERLISRFRDVVEDVAERLVRNRIVDGDELRRLIAGASGDRR